MEVGSGSSDCEKFDNWSYKGLVIVQAALANFSFCCLLLALVLTLCLRHSQQLVSQRRVLFFVLCTLVSTLAIGINVIGYQVHRSPHLQIYCTVVGFLYQVSSLWTVLAVSCIMVDVSLRLSGENHIRHAKKLELAYITVTFLAPVLFDCWIPFLLGGYGQAGPICWIRHFNETDDCQEISSGIPMIIGLYFVPVGIMLVLLAMWLFILLAVLQVKIKRPELKFDTETQEMNRRIKYEMRPMLIYPTIFIATNAPNFVVTIYILTQHDMGTLITVFWYLSASLLQLQGMFYSLVLVFWKDVNTGMNIYTTMKVRYSRRAYQRIADYPITEARSDSIREGEPETESLNSTGSHKNPT